MNDKEPKDLEIRTRIKVWGRYYFITDINISADGRAQIEAKTGSRLSKEYYREEKYEDENRKPQEYGRFNYRETD